MSIPYIQSTSTLLQVVNEILRTIGERSVSSIDTPIARKVLNTLNQAVKIFQSAHDWTFLQKIKELQSVQQEQFYVGNVQRVRQVAYGSSSDGYVYIPFVTSDVFHRLPITPLPEDDNKTPPRYYTLLHYNVVSLNPYPWTSSQLPRLKFHVIDSIELPTNADSTLPLPERYIPLLVLKASSLLFSTYLEDKASAQQYSLEYLRELSTLRTRERGHPSKNHNMFRRF